MRAVIYCRVSTKEQASSLSLPAQKKACTRFCKDEDWAIDRILVERGKRVAPQTWDRTLKNPIDAGRIQMDDWGYRRRGRFRAADGVASQGDATPKIAARAALG